MGFCSAVFGAKYRRASIVCFMSNIFNQYSGIAPIIMFCPRLLKMLNEKSEGDSAITIEPIVGSVILTAVSALGCILSLWTIKKTGRKTLLVFG